MVISKTITRSSVAALAIAAAPVLASEDAESTSMKTSWGVPDLQGTWDFRTMTPMNRPERFKDKEFLTDEEIAELEERTRQGHQDALAREASDEPSQGDVDVGYDFIFIDVGTKVSGTRRTSLIVDPPDGRRPPLTMFAKMRQAENRDVWEKRPITARDRPPATRCLVGFNSGPPMSSGAYNNMMRVVQSPGYVAILNEMVNDHRVIPTDGSEHVPDHVRLWKGDSRGRWDGDTLVVETRNFRPETSFSGSGPNMILTERFTRISTLTPYVTSTPWTTWSRSKASGRRCRTCAGRTMRSTSTPATRATGLCISCSPGPARKNATVSPTQRAGCRPGTGGLPKKEDLLKDSGEGE